MYKIYDRLKSWNKPLQLKDIELFREPSDKDPLIPNFIYKGGHFLIIFSFINFHIENENYVYEIYSYKNGKAKVIGWEKLKNLHEIEDVFKSRIISDLLKKI
jgi:hypothetical protein